MTLKNPSDNRRTVMVLGAGRGQVGLIRAVNSLGHRSVVASLPSQTAPGLRIANDVVHVDIADVEGIVRAAREQGVDAVVTGCADTGVPALGVACDELGLVGLSSTAAAICANKIPMKQAFLDAGVRTAEHETVSSLEEAQGAVARLGLPVLVKAADLQGSKGIVIVKELEALEDAYRHVAEATTQDEVIVEQFIEGREFGAQVLVRDGEVLFTLLHNDDVHVVKTAVPVLHSVPISQGPDFQAAAVAEIEKAIRATGLDNCAVNVDLISRGDEVFVIELTGRVGANGLPEMVSRYFGVDYYEVLVRLALGEPIDADWTQGEDGGAVVVKMIIAPELSGTIEAIEVDRTVVPEAEYLLFRSNGDQLAGFRHSGDCIGQITLAATTLAEAERRMALAEAAINIRMVDAR